MNALNYAHKSTEVASFPAYKIMRRETCTTFFGTNYLNNAFTVLDAGDQLGLDSGRGYFHTFSINSVLSYALECAEDPIKAVLQSMKRGENMHWINKNSTCLSASPQAQRQLIEVTIGMLVLFEGCFFTIQADHNDNLKLQPVVGSAR